MIKNDIKNGEAASRIQVPLESRYVIFVNILQTRSIFEGKPTHGNLGRSNSNTGLAILKVSNQMARHIVDDMCSIVCSSGVKKTASFDRRQFNSKQEIHLVCLDAAIVPKRNRSRCSAVPVIVGKRMDLLEPRFHLCAIFTS